MRTHTARRSTPRRKAIRLAGTVTLSMAVALGASVTASPTPGVAAASASPVAASSSADEPSFRTIITTDSDEFRKDDVVSFYRYLLYSNEFADSLKGIVYSSFFGGPPEEAWPTDLLQGIIRDQYSLVYENLRLHDPRYPSPEDLESVVKVGNIRAPGDMSYDSEGSLLIKEELLSDDPRPLYLQTWGGTNTIGAALRSIEEEYSASPDWEEMKSEISSNAMIYILLDQDPVFKEYIDDTWPELDVIVNYNQYNPFGYPVGRASTVPAEINEQYFGVDFMESLTEGALLENMPVADEGSRGGAGAEGTCFCEGDSPVMLHTFPTGLRSMEDPTYGGWGGRFEQTAEHRWSDSPAYMSQPEWWLTSQRPSNEGAVKDDSPYGEQWDQWYPQSRWIPAIQNDFLARVQWQSASYEDANHAPEVSTPGGRLDISAKPGQHVQLVGLASDPDGDELSTSWWQYREAGTYPGSVDISKSNDIRGASIRVPADAQPGDTIHVILEVTDNGEIPLTRYQRVIVTVR
jgi:hypothetical protein